MRREQRERRHRQYEYSPQYNTDPDMCGLRYHLGHNSFTALDRITVYYLSNDDVTLLSHISATDLMTMRIRARMSQRILGLRLGISGSQVALYELKTRIYDEITCLRWVNICDTARRELSEWQTLHPREARVRADISVAAMARRLNVKHQMINTFEEHRSPKLQRDVNFNERWYAACRDACLDRDMAQLIADDET